MVLAFDSLRILALYAGVGFLMSRGIVGRYRNHPLAWLMLSLVFVPLLASVAGQVLPVEHRAVVWASLACIGAGVLVQLYGRKRERVISLVRNRPTARLWERGGLILIAVIVLVLLLPKLTVVRSLTPSIMDDINNVNKLLSVSADIGTPRYFHMPLLPFSYYYYDFVLPAIVFRVTSLTAQQSLLIHAALSYIAILWFLAMAALHLFVRPAARLFFFAAVTVLGGLDWIPFVLKGMQIPGHLEWWANDTSIPKDFSAQISSFHTLFLWVPQHLMAGMIAFAILLIAGRAKDSLIDRVIIAALFAALLGFSTFVFLTAALSYLVLQIILLHRSGGLRRASIVRLLAQAVVFILLALHLILLFAGRGGVLYLDPKVLTIWSVTPESIPFFLRDLTIFLLQALQYLLAQGLLLFVDTGIVGLLALAIILPPWLQRSKSNLLWTALVFFLVTFFFLSFFSSINYNDLYMRGIIIAQLALVLLAAFAVDRVPKGRRSVTLGALMLPFLVLQAATPWFEWRGRMQYDTLPVEPMYRFMRTELPKDAILFTDAAVPCGHITYRGNRLCMNNMYEVDRQYAVRDDRWDADYHDPMVAAKLDLEAPRYFVEPITAQPALFPVVYADKSYRIYRLP